LVEVKVSDEINLEIEHAQKLRLFLQNIFGRDSFVSYLF
jgi:hypothetical protein